MDDPLAIPQVFLEPVLTAPNAHVIPSAWLRIIILIGWNIIGIRLINRDQGQARPGRRSFEVDEVGVAVRALRKSIHPAQYSTTRHKLPVGCWCWYVRTSAADRDGEHGVRMVGNRKRARERERERWPTTPKMGYLPLPTLCTMNPAFDSATVDVLCFVASLVARRGSLSPLSKNFSEFRHGPRLRIISLDRVAGFRTWIVYTMCNFRDGRCRHAKDYGWECCLRATDVGCRSGWIRIREREEWIGFKVESVMVGTVRDDWMRNENSEKKIITVYKI